MAKKYMSESHKQYCLAEKAKRIARAKELMALKKGGMHPDDIAKRYGLSPSRTRALLAGVR